MKLFDKRFKKPKSRKATPWDINIGKDNDRRIKLSDKVKAKIKRHYTGKRGEIQRLADEYGVSWTAIKLIVSPKTAKEKALYQSKTWFYHKDLKARRAAASRTRDHKRLLIKKLK